MNGPMRSSDHDDGKVARVGRRRARGGRIAVLAAFLGLLAPAAPGSGATQAERTEALRDLQEGNRLFDAGDYLAALARFESAYAKVPSPKLFFNFAQVHRRLGRTVEALDFYERYLAETPDAPAKLRTEAQQRTADLKKRVATIAIRSAAVGHEVTVDGRSCGVTPLGRAVTVLPGSHQVVVQSGAAGAAPFVQKVEAHAGESLVVVAPVANLGPAGAGGGAGTSPSTASLDPGRPGPTPPSSGTPGASATVTAGGPAADAPAGMPTASASPSPAGPTEDAAAGEHHGRLGLQLRADVDRGLAGAGLAGALGFAVLEPLELSVGGFRWPVNGHGVPGVALGVTGYFLRSAVRPLLALEGQLYFQSAGTHFGARAAAGVQWDAADHLGLYAMAGVQYTSTEISTDESTLFFVPSLGVQLRL